MYDLEGQLGDLTPLLRGPRTLREERARRFARTTRRRADGTTRNRPPRPEGGRGRSCRPVVASSLAVRREKPPPSAAGGRRDDELTGRREIVPLVPKAGGGDPVVVSSCHPVVLGRSPGEGLPPSTAGRRQDETTTGRKVAPRSPKERGAERSERRRAPARRTPRQAPSPGDASSQKLWSRRIQKVLPSRFVRGPGKPDQEARRKDALAHAPCLPAVLISKFSRFRTIDGLQRSKSVGA